MAHGQGPPHPDRREGRPAPGASFAVAAVLPERTRCVIAGGGPAGLFAGYLLARAGIDTLVLEKHADFLRDFRGDTIHPSTMDALAELGLLEAFLALPHREARYAEAEIGGA